MRNESSPTWLTALKMGSLAMAGVLYLFGHVWWPVQAERSRLAVKKANGFLSQRKYELEEMDRQLSTFKSLDNLDRWAKAHGPWRTPGADDIIVIRK